MCVASGQKRAAPTPALALCSRPENKMQWKKGDKNEKEKKKRTTFARNA